jgi:NSS family neurotransmitter:Na+ symporter
MEFSMGRASRKSPIELYKPLEPKGTKWHLHGYGMLAGLYLLMMFYTSVAGWMVKYFVSTVRGEFVGLGETAINAKFSDMLANPLEMTIYTFIIIILGFLVCSFSLQGGLERVSKFMMIALLAIMVGLAVNSITLEGAKEGLMFYLIPDFSKMDTLPELARVASGAMQQAFFTLSLGIGSMAIFGSYINKDRALLGESLNVAVLDTFVAVTSGLIIFPACFAFDIDVNSGPALIFMTLPRVFNNIGQPFGQILGSFFFLFLFFAAFTTVIAVFQAIIACTQEKFGWSKKKSCLINCILMMVLSLPCIFGFLFSFDLFGKQMQVLDIEDFLVSNNLLPLGAAVFLVFCTTRYGWGWNNFLNEANEGKGMKFLQIKPYRFYLTYILPLVILILTVMAYIPLFKK